MSGSRSAPASMGSGDGLGGIAQMISVLSPLLLGSGSKTSSSTQTSTVAPDILNLLKGIISTSTANANDPTKTDGIVKDIMTKAGLALAPQLKSGASSGLYNSETLSMLAARQQAEAVNASSQAVLNYQTQQQQIAATTAAQVGSLTKTTTESGKVKQAATVPPGMTALLMAGVGGYSNHKKLTDMLGLTDKDSDTINHYSDSIPIPPIPPGYSGASELSGGINFGGDSLHAFDNSGSIVDSALQATSQTGDAVQLATGLTEAVDETSPIFDAVSSIGSAASDGFQKFLNLFSF